MEEKLAIESNLKASLIKNENLQNDLKIFQSDFSDLKQKLVHYEKALNKVGRFFKRFYKIFS